MAVAAAAAIDWPKRSVLMAFATRSGPSALAAAVVAAVAIDCLTAPASASRFGPFGLVP